MDSSNSINDSREDILLPPPLSAEPSIESIEDETEMTTTSSYLNSEYGEMDERTPLVLPFAPPPYMPPTPPPSISPASPPATATPQSSPQSCSANNPLQRKQPKQRKITKAKPTPKYKINPEDCGTEMKKIRVMHAIKFRRNRIRRRKEKEALAKEVEQINVHLTNQCQVLEEELRAEMSRHEAQQLELDRLRHAIDAILAWH